MAKDILTTLASTDTTLASCFVRALIKLLCTVSSMYHASGKMPIRPASSVPDSGQVFGLSSPGRLEDSLWRAEKYSATRDGARGAFKHKNCLPSGRSAGSGRETRLGDQSGAPLESKFQPCFQVIQLGASNADGTWTRYLRSMARAFCIAQPSAQGGTQGPH